MNTRQTTLISTGLDNTEADSVSSSPVFSSDGRSITFRSHAGNLEEGDTNYKDDIYLFKFLP